MVVLLVVTDFRFEMPQFLSQEKDPVSHHGYTC